MLLLAFVATRFRGLMRCLLFVSPDPPLHAILRGIYSGAVFPGSRHWFPLTSERGRGNPDSSTVSWLDYPSIDGDIAVVLTTRAQTIHRVW
jgi:hypothetical protein